MEVGVLVLETAPVIELVDAGEIPLHAVSKKTRITIKGAPKIVASEARRVGGRLIAPTGWGGEATGDSVTGASAMYLAWGAINRYPTRVAASLPEKIMSVP